MGLGSDEKGLQAVLLYSFNNKEKDGKHMQPDGNVLNHEIRVVGSLELVMVLLNFSTCLASFLLNTEIGLAKRLLRKAFIPVIPWLITALH